MLGLAALAAIAVTPEKQPPEDLLRPSPPPRRDRVDRTKQPGWNKPNILKKYRRKDRP